MEYFKQFYSNVSTGIHRSDTEEFFAKEAAEKLFHIGGGRSLLDFGCGSADLTVYYCRQFEKVIGVDFSENMLGHARSRAEEYSVDNLTLIQADNETVWKNVDDQNIDVVSSSGVIQYLSPADIRRFTQNAARRLSPEGLIVHFDIPDPRIYFLTRLGFMKPRPWRLLDLPDSLVRFGKLIVRLGIDAVRRHPTDIMGFQHHPSVLVDIGAESGLQVDIVSSVYYDYRYHVIMRRIGEGKEIRSQHGG